ncbi:MAG: alanine racemase [Ruminococcaceae bacterium]|nr:alanine racemase [Oscillospiraceae bacterium]
MYYEQKRTWAEVSLKALEHNYNEFRRVMPEGCRYLGVVKANAYGHGASQIAHRLEKLGADYLAVACLDEAIWLRKDGISLPILVLGASPAEYASQMAQYGITQAVECEEKGLALSANLQPGEKLKIHIKIDSGMGRVGFRACDDEQLQGAARVLACENLIAEGVFTHFAVSDEPATQEEYTRGQFEKFQASYKKIEELSGRTFPLHHCANSGCFLNYQEYALDMMRPGLLTYGMYPAAEKGGIDLQPLMQLKSRISMLAHHKKGDSISYGRTFTCDRDCTLAVMPIGYADGLKRCLSGKIDVLVHGQRARQVGRICMDMCMVDVTDIPDVKVGDVVTFFGRDGDEVLPIEEMAKIAGTINYELTCVLTPRVHRVYVD